MGGRLGHEAEVLSSFLRCSAAGGFSSDLCGVSGVGWACILYLTECLMLALCSGCGCKQPWLEGLALRAEASILQGGTVRRWVP